MPKKLNTRLIKLSRSFKLYEISDLFGVSRGTVRNWVKNGLPTIDKSKPYMVHGDALKSWLDEKQKSRKRPTRPGELFCPKCRASRKPVSGSVSLTKHFKVVSIKGVCSFCNCTNFQFGSIKKIPEYEKNFNLKQDPSKAIKGVLVTSREL